MSHWANSSSGVATCSVRPGKAEEVGKIVSNNSSHWLRLNIDDNDGPLFTVSDMMLTRNIRTGQLLELDSSRTPFAIRCSGHSGNPGFSSTRGVQISMVRFNEIVLSKDEKTVEAGAGLTWTSVYQYLVPKGLNVVGARLDDVGLAGFTLGGGQRYLAFTYIVLYSNSPFIFTGTR
jgi:FAD binding domain